ncbi:hypothetical protein CFD26_104936 [Aspergillus turcosus]|uniref:Uncharacterized protein n=1 Tax=Aspergillus turcosus TaxID=1245748 RepID=A0A421D3R3_9EURO|nr:hypothetical protein CFD26_104936 [Aspergillus turcosus]
MPASHNDEDGNATGFDAITRGCDDLVASAERQVNSAKGGGDQDGIQLEYNLSLQLIARLHTNWTVVDGFELSSITLRLAAELASEEDPSFAIKLSANGKIGNLCFEVSAEIPHLDNKVPIKIIFQLKLRSTTTADDLWKSVQGISKGDSQTMPSQMVDESLRSTVGAQLREADLTLTVVKPAGKPFFLSYCHFKIGGDINYRPKIDYPKLEIVRGSLSFLLVRQTDVHGGAKYRALAELDGCVLIANKIVFITATFALVNGGLTVYLRAWNSPATKASYAQRISADTFYKNLLPVGDGKGPESVSGMVSLPSTGSLDLLRHDLTVPGGVQFMLYIEFGSAGLGEFLFQIHARQLCSIEADFLKGCVIRDLVVNVDLRSREQARSCMIAGTLEIDTWRFQAALQYQKLKERRMIHLQAALERAQTGGDCSIAALAQDAMFSADLVGETTTQVQGGGAEPQDTSTLDQYVKENSVPEGSGLSLKHANMTALPADISFEMILSKGPSKQSHSGEEHSGQGKEDSQVSDPSSRGTVGAKEGAEKESELSGYQLEMVRFQAHFGLSWTLIPGHIVMERMGLAFSVVDPTTSKRQIAGYLYGEWTIEKYTLWTYILREQTVDASSITISLNIKDKLESASGSSLASVLADKRLTNAVGMPELELHPDIKTSPQNQDHALAMGYIDLRINDPLGSNKTIDCALIGYLHVGQLQILISSLIKVKTGTQKEIDDSSDQSKAIKDAKADVSEKKKPKAAEDKEDLRFRAQVRYVKGHTKETKPEDVLRELSPSSAMTAGDNSFIPPALGINAEGFAGSLDFYLDMHVGKKTAQDKRSIKSLVLTVAAKGQWDIIDQVLSVRDAGLQLIIVEQDGDRPKRRTFVVYGVVSLFDATAIVPAALWYENGTLSFGVVVIISLTKLLQGLSGHSSSTVPQLLKDQEKAAESGVVASVTAGVKDRKFDFFDVQIRQMGEISIAETFTIDQCLLAYSKSAGSEDRTLKLSGRLNWGQPGKRNSLSASVSFTGETKIVVQFSLNKSPGKMLDDFLGDKTPSKDQRPELPGAVGFADWDSDSYTAGDKTTMMSELVFEQLDRSQGRQFKSIAFVLKAANDWKWELIEGWFWFTDLQFKLLYTVPVKALSLQLVVTVGFMRRVSSGDKEGQKGPSYKDSVEVTMTATKEGLTLTFPTSKIEGCNSTDLIYCLTAGHIDVPHWLGIPMFPRVVATLDWRQRVATIAGHLTKEGQHWEFNKMMGSILRMENPRLEATVPYQGGNGTTCASIKGEAVLISMIKLRIEYVLPKGPLKVEDCDIDQIVDMIKRIWDIAKELWNAGKTLFQIAEAIGSFIASAAIAAEAFIEGLFVVGGLLAGWAWGLIKNKLIDAFKALFSDDDDKKEAESGLRQGMKKHEHEDVSRSDPKDKHDDPGKPVGADDPEDPSTTGHGHKEGLEIRGTGSSSGVCSEAVELFVVAYPKTPSAPDSVEEVSFDVSVSMGGELISMKQVRAGYPIRFAYRRPATEGEYHIKVSAKSSANEAFVKELLLSARKHREECISEPQCRVLLPVSITAGVPFSATLVLKDIHGNVIDGYDDRKLLVLNLDANKKGPEMFVRRNGYILHFPALAKGKHSFIAMVDNRQTNTFEIEAVARFDASTASLRGNGVCSGMMGQEGDILVKCLDFTGEVLEDAAVSIVMTSQGIASMIESRFYKEQGVYQATVQRPTTYGEYQLAITVNGQSVGGSHLTLKAHDLIDIQRTRISIVDSEPTQKSQTAVVETFDFVGSRWRLASATFTVARLICTDEAAGEQVVYTGLQDMQDGTYHIDVELQRDHALLLSLALPDGRKSSGQVISIPDRTLATTFFASGHGLQSGHEGTVAVVDLFGFNALGQPSVLKERLITATVVQMNPDGTASPIHADIQASKIVYTRPKSLATDDGDKLIQGAAAEVYMRIFYGNLEAYGSPFRVLSVPYFVDIVPLRWEMVHIPRSSHTDDPAGPQTTGLILIDNHERMMTRKMDIVVRKVDGQRLNLCFLPSGIYEPESQPAPDSSCWIVTFQGNDLAGPQAFSSSGIWFSLASSRRDVFDDRLTVQFQASGSEGLNPSDFECIMYPVAVKEESIQPDYFRLQPPQIDAATRIVTFAGILNAPLPASLHSKWYALSAKYRHLPLQPSADSGSLGMMRSLPGASPDPPPSVTIALGEEKETENEGAEGQVSNAHEDVVDPNGSSSSPSVDQT